jgi:hypothetical protein
MSTLNSNEEEKEEDKHPKPPKQNAFGTYWYIPYIIILVVVIACVVYYFYNRCNNGINELQTEHENKQSFVKKIVNDSLASIAKLQAKVRTYEGGNPINSGQRERMTAPDYGLAPKVPKVLGAAGAAAAAATMGDGLW